MTSRLALASFLVAASSTAPVLADSPLPPPSRIEVCSPSGTSCAIADPAAGTITVRERASGKVLWTLKGWRRSFFVTDDGKGLVLGPDGLNLLPLGVKPSEPLLRFYRSGALVRTVLVGDLFPDVSVLRRTVSHVAWGSVGGISRRGRLLVELVDGRRVAFDPATGLQTSP